MQKGELENLREQGHQALAQAGLGTYLRRFFGFFQLPRASIQLEGPRDCVTVSL